MSTYPVVPLVPCEAFRGVLVHIRPGESPVLDLLDRLDADEILRRSSDCEVFLRIKATRKVGSGEQGSGSGVFFLRLLDLARPGERSGLRGPELQVRALRLSITAELSAESGSA